MALLTQDPTQIGGNQQNYDALVGQYQGQQGAYDQARQQGQQWTQQAAPGVADTTMGLGTLSLNNYAESQMGSYLNQGARSNDAVGTAQSMLGSPSVAQAQAQQTYNQAAGANLAQAGASNNSALGARNALQANANAAQNVAGQAAAARAAEVSQRQGNLLAAQQGQNALNLQAVGSANQQTLNQQNLYMQGQQNLANTGLAQQQAYMGGYQGQQTLQQNQQLTQAQLDQQRQAANQAAIMGFTGQVVGAGAQAAAMGA